MPAPQAGCRKIIWKDCRVRRRSCCRCQSSCPAAIIICGRRFIARARHITGRRMSARRRVRGLRESVRHGPRMLVQCRREFIRHARRIIVRQEQGRQERGHPVEEEASRQESIHRRRTARRAAARPVIVRVVVAGRVPASPSRGEIVVPPLSCSAVNFGVAQAIDGVCAISFSRESKAFRAGEAKNRTAQVRDLFELIEMPLTSRFCSVQWRQLARREGRQPVTTFDGAGAVSAVGVRRSSSADGLGHHARPARDRTCRVPAALASERLV